MNQYQINLIIIIVIKKHIYICRGMLKSKGHQKKAHGLWNQISLGPDLYLAELFL